MGYSSAGVDEPDILTFRALLVAALGLGLVCEGSGASNGTGNIAVPATPPTFAGDATHGTIGGVMMVSVIGLMNWIL